MKNLFLILSLLVSIVLSAQEMPVEATHIPTTSQVTWKWRQVDNATGYKFNTVNNYGTATDLTTDTSYVETPLSANTTYTRYAWAYNACGNGSPVTLTQKTLDDFVCGTGVTISHVAGTTAPVSKTVTYGTVEMAGEEDKCWITRNLGASQQATALTDTTEASAGWYWQFNRKQGYKHNGLSRTPDTEWITSINEYYDWETENDPCAILMANDWRMPTYTEFYNIEKWSLASQAYASDMKLHSAGKLRYSNGDLEYKGDNNGIGNHYWTTTTYGGLPHGRTYNLYQSTMDLTSKKDGVPIRCIKETSTAPPPGGLSAPTAGTHTPSETQIVWKWNTVSGATGYKWNTTNSYSTAEDMSTAVQKTQTGLTCNTSYSSYVWAYDGVGNSNSTLLSQSTLTGFPDNPAEGTHTATMTQITWRWSTASGATGYKFNTTNNYFTATDMSDALTTTELSLATDSLYTRYAWSYNDCGYSTATTLTQSTLGLEDWECGDDLNIAHTAGIVAAESKTVDYGTALMDTTCWITQNLGSSQQATSSTDATEASAGWYWQFNKKQGYKHSGTSRTPSTAWITTISENSSWTEANDPCTIEMGSGWRIPTYQEWWDIDNTEIWRTLSDTYGSDLKLHAAGRLNASTGNLLYRGSIGTYWSSTQGPSPGTSRSFFMSSSSASTNYYSKTHGFTIRCINTSF